MRVALYIRRSTNERLQADSLKVQEQILRTYAREHEMEVVETFTDSASGTSTKHRTAFLRMVERITHGAPFNAVLVRDVSRFGRFFDVDEAAFFEVLFLGHGVRTVYCEEVFTSDTSPMASLLKSVRRVMASEYSRDRSRLVRYAQSRATRLGFMAGGPPPYGMRRAMVTPGGRHVQFLDRGEWKALANHRTRLVAGAPDAVATIRRVFDLYDRDGLRTPAIARALNEAGIRTPTGSHWYDSSVYLVLSNSRYAGFGSYRPTWKGISDPLSVEQVAELTVRDAVGPEAIIGLEQFRRVEARQNRLTSRRSNETLAIDARIAFEQHGCVEPAMLESLALHCSWGTYTKRFPCGVDGALMRAYAREIADRTTQLVALLQETIDVTEREGVWIADATIRIHIQAVFPHRRRTGLCWRVHPPSIECDVVLCWGVDGSHTDRSELFLVRSDQLAGRAHGLYLRRDGSKRATPFRVTPEALAARVAHPRYTSGVASEVRLLQAAREQPLVNFSAIARALDWPSHVVRAMYRNLLARGEWFPPLNYRAGRVVEIVCSRCGKSRLSRPKVALALRSGLCFTCATTRPKHLIKIRCPRCGREAERLPSAVRRLSSGAQTVCRMCLAKAGIRKRHVGSATATIR